MTKVKFGNYEARKDKEKGSKSIVVNVFFDGTLNNRNNTRARVSNQNRAEGKPYNRNNNPDGFIAAEDGDTSFYNDESNVSRLEEYVVTDQENVFSIYTEGIGTEDYQEDEQIGTGYGSSDPNDENIDTGILGKVRVGCQNILEKVEPTLGKVDGVCFTFNVFGFSRGAAAARNFVHEVGITNTRPDSNTPSERHPHGHIGVLFADIDIALESVEVNFVGLYDTVSSYHLNGPYRLYPDTDPNFEDDVQELNLNSLGSTNYVLHLTAADEKRINFSLTNINSARNGRTISLPGVHSDIGGGYVDGMNENGIVLYDFAHWSSKHINRERQLLIDEGWYLDDGEELVIDTAGVNELLGFRENLSNKYSHIPLYYMLDYSKQEGNISFLESDLKTNFTLDSFLGQVKTRLDRFVNNGDIFMLLSHRQGLTVHDPNYQSYVEDDTMLRRLRNRYLHISYNYTNLNVGVPTTVEPMAPREGGRQIIPG
ncbi:phospholipase effector Tle1 domain-containing protein [Aquimarina algicola]|uniref:DUF2235 domain-containing protein n=1 Tax=Aquimarina algicola TaxID=2589995 RepID=A0A504JMR8_9FLAO|nr:DUF2235 domain-containing protein [Aquimarina algicola]TPN89088.1 DUF2235 domain-containing protein [Aquimarina algicola]